MFAYFNKNAKKIEVNQVIDEDSWPTMCCCVKGNNWYPAKIEMEQAGREVLFNVNDFLGDRSAR